METLKFAPIVLFVYNRLEHSKRTIDALKLNPEAKDSVLYIFSDGPKHNASEEQLKAVYELRKYIHTINGFKKIIIEEAEINKGLAKSTIEGISKVIHLHDRVIVLEDDDTPSPFFLAYENECLLKFKDDERYWMVSGYVNNRIVSPLENGDVYAVHRNSSWGFGTWARCWNKVQWDIEIIRKQLNYSVLYDFAKQGGYDLPIIMIGLFCGHNNSWSVRFEYARYLHGGLTIYPSYSLIQNIGLDGSGTHCSSVEDDDVTYMQHKVNVPQVVEFDILRDKQLSRSFTPNNFSGFLFRHGFFFEIRTFLKWYGLFNLTSKIVHFIKR